MSNDIAAFPILFQGTDGIYFNEGMSLRDYFAAKAMQGMNANSGFTDMTVEEAAEWSYQMADAMLAARKGTK